MQYEELEKYADLLDVVVMHLKEAQHFEALRYRLLYMKLQNKLPASKLTQYHWWIFENHKIKSAEILREWVIWERNFRPRHWKQFKV